VQNERKRKRPEQTGLSTLISQTRKSLHYFFGAIASFAAFATRNFTTVFALI
jgi:hypothetical protein